jgi:hypothetical protein
MTRPLAILVLLALLSACPRQEKAPRPRVVYDVSPWALARDYPAAKSYAGHAVRVRLEPKTYSVEGDDIHVPGSVPFTPPLIVFKCRDDPPHSGELVVQGTVETPVRDSIWRTTRADFCVVVTDCTVVRLPPDHP